MSPVSAASGTASAAAFPAAATALPEFPANGVTASTGTVTGNADTTDAPDKSVTVSGAASAWRTTRPG